MNINDLTVGYTAGTFSWRSYLRKNSYTFAPLSCFKHAALSDCLEDIVTGAVVEVKSPDCKTCCTTKPCAYWFAKIVKTSGYWALLSYVGCSKLDPHYLNVPSRWVNLCTDPDIHPVGWCAKHNEKIVPPKNLEPKMLSWHNYLKEELVNQFTIPWDFTLEVNAHYQNGIHKGMKLEVVDKTRLSLVRSGKVEESIGGRLRIHYVEGEDEEEDLGFWCHERSALIHPVGWAQIIGHKLFANKKYARESMMKTLYRQFSDNDATWDMFLPVYNPPSAPNIVKGMKLEAIDPLNLATICVATVTEVLRSNYLMISIDGLTSENGMDCFCYHVSSPCILPVGFCESHDIQITPPAGYKGQFDWAEYLKKTKSEPAPVEFFKVKEPQHGFREGMYLEAVDLMEPRLVCPASVTRVVGRLLRVHFEGWEDDYDQWCDCDSPDLFPIGWCQTVGYKLEPPKVEGSDKEKKKKLVKKRRKKYKPRKPEGTVDFIKQENSLNDGNIDAVKCNIKKERAPYKKKVTVLSTEPLVCHRLRSRNSNTISVNTSADVEDSDSGAAFSDGSTVSASVLEVEVLTE